MDDMEQAFDEWCVVELLGHRRLAGRVREVQIAGTGMLRLDVPATDGHASQTQYVAPGSVYALHPTTEEIATALAAQCRPQPIQRWELPAADPLPSALERDLSRLADCLEDAEVRCEHDPKERPDPTCAGCIARSVYTIAARHIGGDDPDAAGPDDAGLSRRNTQALRREAATAGPRDVYPVGEEDEASW
jgi:hypothetical protein